MAHRSQNLARVEKKVKFPVYFISSAMFPLDNLPKPMMIISSLDPLTYGVDSLRGTLVNGAHFGLPMDFLVLGVISLLIIWIGSYLFSKIQI